MKNAIASIPLLLFFAANSTVAAGRTQSAPVPRGLTPQQAQQHERHQHQIQEQRKNMQEAHAKMMREMGAKRLQESIEK